MKSLMCISLLLGSSSIYADACFNATKISQKSAYVAAPDIEAAIVSSGSDFGWNVDQNAAKMASYGIVGQLGIAGSDDLMVCITLDKNGQLAYVSYPSKMSKEKGLYKPLKGTKK